MAKSITILGATGSVGKSALSVLESAPDRFQLDTVVANSSVSELAAIARKFNAKYAVTADSSSGAALKAALADTETSVYAGPEAVMDVCQRSVDLVIGAIVGAAGIAPTWAALEAGNRIALANKECMVSAGTVFMAEAARQGAAILPVDSEHNAIWQVFDADHKSAIEAITLTASGGPFRTWNADDIAKATPAQALNHPTWSMGARVTIDSASLMNKGLELIEAKYLFDLEPERLKVLVHPQSIVHGMAHYSDGSVLAHLGNPDMRVPVAYAMHWPERGSSPVKRLDLAEIGTLQFENPNLNKFPCLQLAYQAMAGGPIYTNALNAADELAVAAFLEGRIAFGQIAHIVDTVLSEIQNDVSLQTISSIAEALHVDQTARRLAVAALTKQSR